MKKTVKIEELIKIYKENLRYALDHGSEDWAMDEAIGMGRMISLIVGEDVQKKAYCEVICEVR